MQARSGIVLAAHTTKTAILISNARTDKGGSETEAYREGQREREREVDCTHSHANTHTHTNWGLRELMNKPVCASISTVTMACRSTVPLPSLSTCARASMQAAVHTASV